MIAMEAPSGDVDELVDEVEDIIHSATRRYASLGWDGCHDVDDLRQYLRIIAFRMAAEFDPERGVPWQAFFGSVVRQRIIDFFRSVGGRAGQRLRMVQLSVLDSQQERTLIDFQPEDEESSDGVDAVDWADLVERVKSESRMVRMLVMRASGLTMMELAKREGVSESRVSQMLGDELEVSTAAVRLRALTQGKPITKKPLTIERGLMGYETVNGSADSVDRMLEIFESGGPEMAEKIEQKIQQLQEKIMQLKRMQKALGHQSGTKGTATARRPSGGPLLGDLLLEEVKGTANGKKISTLALKLERPAQAIRMAAMKHDKLEVSGMCIKAVA